MKISETKNSNINEGPLDILTRSGRSQRKAFKQGNQVVKQTTDNLMRQFAEYLGQKGLKNYNQASIEDITAFLDSKNVDTSDLARFNPNRALTKQFVQKKFEEKAREASFGKGAKTTPTSTSGASTRSTRSTRSTASPSGTNAGSTAASGTNAESSLYVKIKDAALNLNAKEKRRLIQHLEKSIRSKPNASAAAPKSKTSRSTAAPKAAPKSKTSRSTAASKASPWPGWGEIGAAPKAAPKPKTSGPTIVDRNFDKSQRLSQYGKVGS